MTDLRQAAQQALEEMTRVSAAGIFEGELKEAITNLRAALAEPQTTHWEGCEAVHPECKTEQEPVAWRYRGNLHEFDPSDWAEGPVTPLYTAPAPRKPLTDEEIVRLMVGEDRVQLLYAKPDDPYFSEFAQGAIRELVESGRAIERAHGIGEQT